MQQSVSGIVYSQSTGEISYSIFVGSEGTDLSLPPWVSADVGSVQTFPCASAPPGSRTALGYVINLPPWNNASMPLPSGLAIIAAPSNFDPSQWFRWTVSGDVLTQKTQVHLRVSGKQIIADSPISTTVQVYNPANAGSFTIAMTNGVAQLSSPLPSGTPVYIVTSDVNFWSDHNFFA